MSTAAVAGAATLADAPQTGLVTEPSPQTEVSAPSGAPCGQPGAVPGGQRRPRLHHVDAMRPVKQVVVITTHCLAVFAPAASGAAGAAVLMTHVGRFAFMFISAAMLVYAYPALDRRSFATFWRRRLLAVALPYTCWTIFYFFMENVGGVPGIYNSTGGVQGSLAESLAHFGFLLGTGYYQLYFLVLLLEFYVIYPVFLWALRWGARHPWALLAASAGLQLAQGALVHWGLMPGWMTGFWGMREVWSYQLFLVAGGLLALHYQAVHRWMCRHWRAVLAAAVGGVAGAEGWYYLGTHTLRALAGHNDSTGAFQPALIPAFLGAIAVFYLLGVLLAHPQAPVRLRAAAQSGADNSYGIYLSQVLFISLLSVLGWGHLEAEVPWPLVLMGAVALVFASACAFTSLLARAPGARATVGAPRRPLRRARGLTDDRGGKARRDENGGHLVGNPEVAGVGRV